jgi:recombination protein RecR
MSMSTGGAAPAGPEIQRLVELIGRLPGLGPRSARRVVLHLLKKREALMEPLAQALAVAARDVLTCEVCGNLDTVQPCSVCAQAGRDEGVICVVEDVSDIWAMERSRVFTGRYHVLGGVLSALDGVGPEALRIGGLIARVEGGGVREVILALDANTDGQTTANYLADRLQATGVAVTRLAHGVPVGGDIDMLDDGTLAAALRLRRGV